MLFPMRAGLAGSLVFSGLHALLLEILRSRSTGAPIDATVLPGGLWEAVQANGETRRGLRQVNAAIDALSEHERNQVRLAVEGAQTVRPLLSDQTLGVPGVPGSLHNLL